MKKLLVTVAILIRFSEYARAITLSQAFDEICRAATLTDSRETRPRMALDRSRGVALRDVTIATMPGRSDRLLPEPIAGTVARIPLRMLLRSVDTKAVTGLIFADRLDDNAGFRVLILLTDNVCGITIAACATASAGTVGALARGDIRLNCASAGMLRVTEARA